MVCVVLFSLFTSVYAQNKSIQNKSIDVSMQEDIKIQTTDFYSKESLYISKGAVLSIQIDNIVFEDEVAGGGLLHITNKNKVTVKTIKPITVARVKIENTTIDMQSDIVISGALHLKSTTILLNDFNLHTKKKVIFEDEKSKIVENGEGVWIRKSDTKDFVTHQKNTQKNIEIVWTITESDTMQSILNNNSLFERELLFNSPHIKNNKPPPRKV